MHFWTDEVEKFKNTGRKIYEHLKDEESRYLFEKRLCYMFTGEYQYIRDIIDHLPEKKLFDNMIKSVMEQQNPLLKKILWIWVQLRKRCFALNILKREL